MTERTKIRVEVRRQTLHVGMAEFPLAVSLFVVEPRAILLCRLASAAVVFGVSHKYSPQKKAFNLALISLEVAIACMIFSAFGRPVATDPVNWLAALAAVVAFVVVGCICVYAVISLSQGWPSRQQTVLMFAPTIALAPFGTTLAIVVVLLTSVDKRAVGLVAVLFLIAALGYRTYARVLRQHATLGQVYRYGQFLEGVQGRADAVEAALDRARELLNATTGVIVLSSGSSSDAAVVWSHAEEASGAVLPSWSDDPIVKRCMADTRAIRVLSRTAPEEERAALQVRGAEDVLAVAFRFHSAVRGHLELWDPQGALSSFTDDDLRFLENLASHLAAAIENERLVNELRHAAYHDRLTGLPNRERFTQAVDAAIAAARDGGHLAAVLLLDLDSFKDVNDAMGHDYGDELLIMVGTRLRDQGPDGGLAARMGADEFAMLCPVVDLGAALARAEAVREALSAPYPLARLTVEVGVSIGVAVAPDHAQHGGALLQRADVALYHAKNTGRRITSYLPSMNQASVHRLQLVTQLREAISDGQVQVQYQPKIALETRELIGVEALVRWLHPDYGRVMPDEFVPLAERTGLIEPLTTYVLRTALSQCRSWLERDMRIGVAVNLSVRSLLDAAFPDLVARLLADSGVPPDLLTFEITENNVMTDPERSLPVLTRLHKLGIWLSIDDFGTGYSSLAYLRKLPVDEVKIDKDFVLTMGTDLGDLAIVRAIVELGRSLSLRVVAEGVEDELARDLLSGMGCDVIQGFLVSRALSAERLDAWLTARTALRPQQAGLLGRRPQLIG
jgi:diguanylate cyclase (GGDEF)-like protein